MSDRSSRQETPQKPARRGRVSSSARAKYGSLGKQASPEACRRAAAVLEVLAGVRIPSEAAAALGISSSHYYVLERKSLVGLLTACEPEPKATHAATLEKRLATLQRQLEDCQRQCLRQAALVRATQRAVGLPAVPAKPATKVPGKKNGRARRRRPTVRALRAAESVRKNSSGENSREGLEPMPTQSVMDPSARTTEKEVHGDAKR